MSDVTIVNTTDRPAHVGGHKIAANGRKAVASGQTFTVVADITMPDGNTYWTTPLVLPNGTQTVTASLIEHDGVFEFALTATPGPIPNEIVLVNKCPYPVTFTITAA